MDVPHAQLAPIEQFLAERRAAERIPGLAAAVVADGRLRWSYATGTADIAHDRAFTTDSVCHWFSMTKIVAVTAAMRLSDRGRLDLDAPVSTVAPGLLPPAFHAVTTRHLAQHSAGFSNPLPLRWVRPAGQPLPDQRALVESLLAKQRRPRHPPGTTARYSNVSTMVLGEVVAEVTGQPFVDHVAQEILAPLRMSDTGFAYTPDLRARAAVGYVDARPVLTPLLRRYLPKGIVGERAGRHVAFEPFEMDAAACSGLIGTVTDAVRFATMHLNDGTVDGTTVLQPQTARAMREITIEGKPYDLGLGWLRSHRDRHPSHAYVEHLGGGGGFWNTMRLYPERGIAVVVMGNTTRRYDVGAIADRLALEPWS